MVYGAEQQNLRLSANSPQVQMAYDAAGSVAASSGALGGEAPSMPAGVLEYAAGHGEDRVTWMPNATVRLAAVVVRVGGQAVTLILGAPGRIPAGR